MPTSLTKLTKTTTTTLHLNNIISMHASLRKELGARHSLLNLSVHDLVEEFARHLAVATCPQLRDAQTPPVFRKAAAAIIYYIIVTELQQRNYSLHKYSKKHLKVRKADASKQVGANVRERENKNRSSLYYSNSNSDTATKKTRIKACAQLIKRQRLESEAQLRKASEEEELAKTKKEKREKEAQKREAKSDSLLDSDNYCLDSSSDINPKDDSENEEATTAKDLAREQKERLKALLNAKIRDSLSARKNKIVAIDPANSILCDLSDLLVIRFCIFSNPALENIGILTNKKVVEMQTDTATALANKLAAVNKLIIAEANMPAVHSKATKHRLAPSAAQFALVCGFRKVDRYVFRANNTISIETNAILLPSHLSFTRIFKSITKDTNRKHRLCPERSSAVDKVTGKHIYKTCNRVYALTAKTLSL
ncbi:hypothetical protein HBI51_099930 [Parastagonospora nodorum]|nr:hypothetical protein HBI51_099930 [Parastagonospora nodorum]